MKRTIHAVLLVFLSMFFFGCVSTGSNASKTAIESQGFNVNKAVIEGKPSAYCTVVSDPHPDLFGHWVGQNVYTKNAAWFGEKNGQYAFYYQFQSIKIPKKINSKWRPNIVDGTKITNPAGVMKFWVDGGVFYSQYKDEPVTTYIRYVEK